MKRLLPTVSLFIVGMLALGSAVSQEGSEFQGEIVTRGGATIPCIVPKSLENEIRGYRDDVEVEYKLTDVASIAFTIDSATITGTTGNTVLLKRPMIGYGGGHGWELKFSYYEIDPVTANRTRRYIEQDEIRKITLRRGDRQPENPIAGTDPPDKLDVLIRLLERKGVLNAGEFEEALEVADD